MHTNKKSEYISYLLCTKPIKQTAISTNQDSWQLFAAALDAVWEVRSTFEKDYSHYIKKY